MIDYSLSYWSDGVFTVFCAVAVRWICVVSSPVFSPVRWATVHYCCCCCYCCWRWWWCKWWFWWRPWWRHCAGSPSPAAAYLRPPSRAIRWHLRSVESASIVVGAVVDGSVFAWQWPQLVVPCSSIAGAQWPSVYESSAPNGGLLRRLHCHVLTLPGPGQTLLLPGSVRYFVCRVDQKQLDCFWALITWRRFVIERHVIGPKFWNFV